MNFLYTALPWNIIFTAGARKRLPEELAKLGCSRALVLATPNQADTGEELVSLLGERAVGLFDQAMMHVPGATLEQATAEVKRLDADCTVAVGGGSTTGLGKALAFHLDLPNIVLPTSYAGSEMTNLWAVTRDDRKVTRRDNVVVPTLTIYDPELTLTLPPAFAAASGMNAMAQAVANAAAEDANPISSTLALEGIRALAHSLPLIIAEPGNMDARAGALYGSCLAGAALGTGTTGLHHRLCHTFGGAFNTPHAETHTVLLPHSVAYNAGARPEATRRIAEALGVNDAAAGLFDLAGSLGAPTALKDIGVAESNLDEAAAITVEKPLNNPEPVTRERVRALLDNAFYGNTPEPA
ncbi:MAG: maleylacetate reductase [Gammaproteobacteria bacterium]|nr:maleylacetate reductase [Gammaproteobacteria bacterium]